MVLFDDWSGIAWLVVVTAGAYAALVAVLRVAGKRTLSKLNAFDLVVTVAFGSTLATASLSRSVPLAEAIAAFAMLALLQFSVNSATVRRQRLRGIVTSSPSLLVRDGEVLEGALERERVTEDEIAQAVRQQGIGSFGDVGDVVLETDGSLSVIRSPGDRTAYRGVASVDDSRHDG